MTIAAEGIPEQAASMSAARWGVIAAMVGTLPACLGDAPAQFDGDGGVQAVVEGGQNAGPDATTMTASDGGAGAPDSASGGGADAGCGDTTASAANCGACGHGCMQGACSQSQCQPFSIGSFAQSPALVAADGAYVYGGLGGAIQTCAVDGCGDGGAPIPGGAPPTLLALTANASGVFWAGTDASGTQVIQGCGPVDCTAAAPTLQTVTSQEGQIQALGADSSNVYFSVSSSTFLGIQSCPNTGCPAEPGVFASQAQAPDAGPLEFPPTLSNIAAAGGAVFWAWIENLNGGPVSTSIQTCPSGGCGSASPSFTTISGDTPSFQSPFSDGTSVFWTDSLGVYSCPVSGCPSGGPLVLGPISAHVTGLGSTLITADGTNAYWVTLAQGGTSWNIVRCAVAGCGTPTPIAKNVPMKPVALVGDATSLYWVNGVTVMRLAK
ncbi:MAG TPA: hypothetical protein VHV30_08960 [Polyangiaceae bacterium]|nr:hypothetical protein [Polyangiaceae bacterium]